MCARCADIFVEIMDFPQERIFRTHSEADRPPPCAADCEGDRQFRVHRETENRCEEGDDLSRKFGVFFLSMFPSVRV